MKAASCATRYYHAAEITEPFYCMQEPNTHAAYDEGAVWHRPIGAIAEFVEGLERLAFKRAAYLGQRHTAQRGSATRLPRRGRAMPAGIERDGLPDGFLRASVP